MAKPCWPAPTLHSWLAVPAAGHVTAATWDGRLALLADLKLNNRNFTHTLTAKTKYPLYF